MNYSSNPKINGTKRSPWRKFVNQNKANQQQFNSQFLNEKRKELKKIVHQIDDFWNILEETESQQNQSEA